MDSSLIKEKLKKNDTMKFTKKEKNDILYASMYTLGIKSQLTVCIEECAELIEVISDNTVNKINYIHTAEEIADVLYIIEILKFTGRIKAKEISKVKKRKPNKSTIFTAIMNLSKSQQLISKVVREFNMNNNIDKSKLIDAINRLNETCYLLRVLFKIKQKDINAILDIKYERTHIRLTEGNLK